MKKNIAMGLFIACIISHNAYAQIARIEPEKPVTGQKLIVTYDTKAGGAKFTLDDDVYIITLLSPFNRLSIVKAPRSSDVFKHEMTIDAETSHIKISFMTMSDVDRGAIVSSNIYRADGRPGRGANQNMIESFQFQEMFDKEIALYPDNYAAYAEKWRATGFYGSKEIRANISQTIKDDLTRLAKEVKGESAEYLYALVVGNLLLKQEPQSRDALKRLVAMAPSSPLVGAAISGYTYETFSAGLKDGRKEIEALKRDVITQHPETRFARDSLAELIFDYETTVIPTKNFPFETFEKITNRWIEDEPQNPMPRLYLAQLCLERKHKTALGISLVEQAIQFLLENKLRLYNGPDGNQSSDYLLDAYFTHAALLAHERQFARAFTSLKAAQTLEREDRDKSIEFRTNELEGRIWQGLGDTSRAERAYLIAWRRGSDEAEKALKSIYEKREGKPDGFRGYLRNKSDEVTEKSPAALFNATALDGKPLNLMSLRGKIVVLNFWFIACAPCRVEMPSLNELVKEFKNKDVVFIAFASDEENDLQEFLKKNKFDYQIAPSASEVMKLYQVGSFPTNIIIDRNGLIEARSMGGSDKTGHELKRLIERILD